MRPILSIKQRIMLGFTLMILLVIIASGTGLLYTKSVERTVTAMRNGSEQIESIVNLQISWLAIVATVDNMLLTRQTSLIKRRLNGEVEDLYRQLTALQSQSWGKSPQVVTQNQGVVDNLQALGAELKDVTDELAIAVQAGRWAQAQFLRHNELASLERRLGESLDQLSTNVRNDVDASVAELVRTENRLRTYWAVTALVALGIGSLVGFLIIASIIRPIAVLVATAQAIRDGDLSVRAEVTNRDEFGVLAGAFNSMTTRLRDLILDLEQEVSERKRTEEALRISEERYRSLVENIDLGITLIDTDYRIIVTNAAQGRLFNKPAGELADRECFRELKKRDAVCPHCPGVKAMATGRPHEVETEGIRSDGSRFPIRVQAFPLHGPDDAAVGFIEVVEDITERKRTEEELRKYREHLEELVKKRTAELAEAKGQAEAANRAKSVFLTSMSHELRTPLNAILGYAQIFKRRPLEPDVIRGLNIVQQSGEHLLTLINDILDISKIEVDQMKLSFAPIHLPRFLDDIASIIHSRAAAKRLTFTLERLNTLPTWVEADETRLRQVLLNLLDNAIKFTDEGQVTLRVSELSEFNELGELKTHPTHSTHKTLRFEVADTGPGIPPDQVERIFFPFEQAEDVIRWTKGAGLGLSISRQLVRLMGGELYVESELGRGSTFWFEVTLPVIEVAEEVRFAELPGRVITGYRGPRPTVLVVDDVPSNRAVVVDLLEPLGFEVIEAADGQQALHLAQELRPDLILLDRWMPVLDGFEAVRQMRQMPELEEMVVIVVSASVSEEDQAQGREVGIDAFLPKPVNWPRLATLLAEHLKLEWEYEGKDEGGRMKDEEKIHPSSLIPQPSELVPPPQEEMTVLHDLARRGNMRAIQERAAHIETLGEQYVPFANRLHELARGFEEREILALIERHLEEDR